MDTCTILCFLKKYDKPVYYYLPSFLSRSMQSDQLFQTKAIMK